MRAARGGPKGARTDALRRSGSHRGAPTGGRQIIQARDPHGGAARAERGIHGARVVRALARPGQSPRAARARIVQGTRRRYRIHRVARLEGGVRRGRARIKGCVRGRSKRICAHARRRPSSRRPARRAAGLRAGARNRRRRRRGFRVGRRPRLSRRKRRATTGVRCHRARTGHARTGDLRVDRLRTGTGQLDRGPHPARAGGARRNAGPRGNAGRAGRDAASARRSCARPTGSRFAPELHFRSAPVARGGAEAGTHPPAAYVFLAHGSARPVVHDRAEARDHQPAPAGARARESSRLLALTRRGAAGSTAPPAQFRYPVFFGACGFA